MPSKYCDNTGRCAASNWCSTDYDPRREPEGECPYFHVLTNADKIRQMTDDELAEFLAQRHFYDKLWCKRWLEQEADNA